MILANISNSIHQDFQGSGVNYSNHMLYDISYFNISLQNLQYAFFTYLNRAATWWSYACFQRGCPFFPQPTGVWLPGGNERTICIHVEERRMSRGHDEPTWKLRFGFSQKGTAQQKFKTPICCCQSFYKVIGAQRVQHILEECFVCGVCYC